MCSFRGALCERLQQFGVYKITSVVHKTSTTPRSFSYFPSLTIPNPIFQACELPSSQNEYSHYTCDDNGDVKCKPGWQGDLCDVPICKKGCDPLQGIGI